MRVAVAITHLGTRASAARIVVERAALGRLAIAVGSFAAVAAAVSLELASRGAVTAARIIPLGHFMRSFLCLRVCGLNRRRVGPVPQCRIAGKGAAA
jgi:hypothetical protein